MYTYVMHDHVMYVHVGLLGVSNMVLLVNCLILRFCCILPHPYYVSGMVILSIFGHYTALCLVSGGLIVQYTLIGRIATYVAILTNSVIWSILE